jgi:hypothetical protein
LYYSSNDIDGRSDFIALNDWIIEKKELGKEMAMA